MKTIVIALLVSLFAFGFPVATTSADAILGTQSQTFEHGGGCRKSSPTGQCCHMQTSTGRVHCH